MKRRLLMIAAALFLAFVALALPWARGPRAEVGAATIERRAVALGEVEPEQGSARVLSMRTGTVVKVLVQEGDRVEADAPLAELRPDTADGIVVELDNPTIRSPIAGRVLTIRIHAGDTLGRGIPPEPIFEIADDSKKGVHFELSADVAPLVAASLPVELLPEGGGPALARGKIARLGARARLSARPRGAGVPPVRVVEGWATLDGPAPPLGTAVEVHIVLPSLEVATALPRSAIRIRDGIAHVAVEWGLWTRQVPVKLGVSDAAFVEVQGLPAGARVLREGAP